MGDVLRGPRKVWRWEVVAGLCLIHGFRYGAELGVSQGRFTTFLCSRIPDMRILAVDLWSPLPDRDVDGAETYGDWPHETNYQRFKNHCAEHFAERVTIVRSSTLEAAKMVPDGTLDFVFIDADHTYEGVKNDIAAWTPKVRSRGLIAGHDYNWPTVRLAVNESGGADKVYGDNVWTRFKP